MVPAFPSVDSAETDARLFAALNGTMAESDCFNPFIIDSDYLLSSAAPARRPGRIEALSGSLRGRTYVPGFQRRREALPPSRLPVRLHPLQTPQLDRDPARALAAQVTVESHKQLRVRYPPPDFSWATPRSATDPPPCEAAPANRGPSAFERPPRLRDRRRRRPRSEYLQGSIALLDLQDYRTAGDPKPRQPRLRRFEKLRKRRTLGRGHRLQRRRLRPERRGRPAISAATRIGSPPAPCSATQGRFPVPPHDRMTRLPASLSPCTPTAARAPDAFPLGRAAADTALTPPLALPARPDRSCRRGVILAIRVLLKAKYSTYRNKLSTPSARGSGRRGARPCFSNLRSSLRSTQRLDRSESASGPRER